MENQLLEPEPLFSTVEQFGHEQIVYCHDSSTGLKAIIAIHSTALGPALGGVRIWNYASEHEALLDAVRLSRGMTFKAAISGLSLGGGKAVIIGDVKTIKTEALLRRFGKFIHGLGGRYITSNDVNMNTSDIETIAMETDYVTGLPQSMNGGGSPAPATAYGVYLGIKVTAKKVYGTENLTDKKIVVQGVGHVGAMLVKHLIKEKAKVYITDVDEDKIKNVRNFFNVNTIDKDDVYDMDMDIYAPCALGATLNDSTIPRLKCAMIAGSANNQLQDEIKHSKMLADRNITYAPDFLINAGGLINVFYEYEGNFDHKRTYSHIEKIYDTCQAVLELASKEHKTTHEAAMHFSAKRIEDISKIKISL